MGPGRAGLAMTFTGQEMLRYEVRPGLPHPGCRWLSPTEPPPDLIASCAMGRVPGPAARVIASLQAVVPAKEILVGGGSLPGARVLHDAPSTELCRAAFPRRTDRSACGPSGGNGAGYG